MKKFLFTLPIVASVLSSTAANAIAYFSGVECEPLYPESTQVYKSYYSAGIQNISGSSKTFVCPIREEGWDDNVWAADIQVSPGVNQEDCRVKARWWGNTVKSWAASSKSVVMDGRAYISWSASDDRSVSGPVYITCTVPDNEWIYYGNVQMD